MPYPKTKAAAEALGLTGADVRDLLETYAAELTEAEPYATRTINEVQSAGRSIEDAIDDDD